MEAWLPQNWTGRFLSGGNGGLNGCIDYVTLGYGAGLGFATVAANNGHNGTSVCNLCVVPSSVSVSAPSSDGVQRGALF